MKGFDVLMRVSIYHAVHEGVFPIFELYILGQLHFAAWEADVEGDIVGPLVERVPLRDLRSWSIIFPSKPQVNLWPFVG